MHFSINSMSSSYSTVLWLSPYTRANNCDWILQLAYLQKMWLYKDDLQENEMRSISFAKFFKGTSRRLSPVFFFIQNSLDPSWLSSSNGLYSSNFLFLCNSHFHGSCLAPLWQHRNVFNTNPGKRTLGVLDTQKFEPKTF